MDLSQGEEGGSRNQKPVHFFHSMRSRTPFSLRQPRYAEEGRDHATLPATLATARPI
jgi:hypothetical protein